MVLEIMKPRSVTPSFRSNEKYNYRKIIKSQFILNDNLSQSIVRKAGGKYLTAAALQNLDDAGKWTPRSSSPPLEQDKTHHAPVRSWARTGTSAKPGGSTREMFPFFGSTE